MKRIFKLGFLLILPIFIFLCGCSSVTRDLDSIKRADKLVVALNAEFPPFEYKEGKDFLGIDVDIIRAYADYIGVECIISDMDFDATFLSVYSSKADLAISGITVNEKRKKSFDFSSSYYYSSQIIIVKSDSEYMKCKTENEVLSLLSKNKASIGVQRGTIGEYYSSGDESWGFDGIANTKTISYDNGALACADLSNGKIDAVILDEAPSKLIAAKYSNLSLLEFILTEEEYAIAVRKGNETLLASLNEFIAKIKKDGTVDSIVVKYYE